MTGRGGRVVGFAIAVTAVVALATPVLVLPSPGVDPGWQTGLALAHRDGLLFGEQVSFTYGPWGWLDVPTYLERGTAFAQVLFRVATSLALVAVCWCLGAPRLGVGWTGAVVVVPVATLGVLLSPDERALAAGFGLALLVLERASADPPPWLSAAALGMLAAVLLQVKVSTGVFATAVVLVVAAATWRHRLVAVSVLGTYLLTVVAGWLLAGQRPDLLGVWLQQSAANVTGYAGAFALYPPGIAPLVVLGVFAAVVVGLALRLVLARSGAWSERAGALVIVLLALYAALKLGYVRQEPLRMAAGYLLLVPVWLAVIPSGRRWLTGALATAVPVGLIGLALLTQWDALVMTLRWHERPAAWRASLGVVLSQDEFDRAVATARSNDRFAFALPEDAAAALRDRRGQVDQWQTAVAWAYEVPWGPVPVFHPMNATDNGLDALNADAALRRGPEEPILIDTTTDVVIDDRASLWTSPRYQLAITCGFRPTVVATGWEIWARSDGRSCAAAGPSAQVAVVPGQAVPLPSPDGPGFVVARFFPRVGLLDTGVAALFKPRRPLLLTLDGRSFRQPWGLAGAPLIVSCPGERHGTDRYRQVCPSPRSIAADTPGTFQFETLIVGQ